MVPTTTQLVPSADWEPVNVDPVRTSFNHRGGNVALDQLTFCVIMPATARWMSLVPSAVVGIWASMM